MGNNFNFNFIDTDIDADTAYRYRYLSILQNNLSKNTLQSSSLKLLNMVKDDPVFAWSYLGLGDNAI